jgi:uncharacterized protein (DUF488 family)
MTGITIYTIGFTRKSADKFFTLLGRSGVQRVIDVRLNNSSQLAGFAKRDDLRYFLQTICGIGYRHEPMLAPTKRILENYKKNGGAWEEYESSFMELMAERRIEHNMPKDILDNGCLLCSEPEPDRCHRRLAAEYLQKQWGDVDIRHLM